MGSSSGTSVIGWQTLYQSSSNEVATQFLVNLDPTSEPTVQQKLGELYIDYQQSGFSTAGWVSVHVGWLTQDGKKIPFSYKNSSGVTQGWFAPTAVHWRMRVNWRLAGINWQAQVIN